jgi:hypothetical protein
MLCFQLNVDTLRQKKKQYIYIILASLQACFGLGDLSTQKIANKYICIFEIKIMTCKKLRG